MIGQFRVWFAVLLLAFFLSGCGCGGNGEAPVALVSLEVTPANPSIVAGSSLQFTATGIFSDNSTQDLTTAVTWSSSDQTVATVSDETGSKGLAESHAVGITNITAASEGISGSTTLTVTAATLVSIEVTPANPGIALGSSLQFTATGTFSDNTTQDMTISATWSSSDASVATVGDQTGSKGLAKSHSAGTTDIIATSGGVKGSTTLTVTEATLVSIEVTPANPSIALGSSRQFTATGTFSDGTTQDLTTSALWNSSVLSVATVSNTAGSKGSAKSLAAGLTDISATSGNITGYTTLTVTAVTLVSIRVTPENPVVEFGTNIQFTATGTYSDKTTQDITKAATWSSSNTAVATISNATATKGLATTDHVVGRSTITATLDGISGSTVLRDP